MSNKQETLKEVNFPRVKDVEVDELEFAMVKWQCQIKDEEKTAESIVMSGMIPHVLERILSFLPVSNLKDCRLVNTDWDKASVLQLRKNLPYLNFPPQNIHSFLDLMLDNKISPFAKFWINPDEIDSHQLQRLLNTIAPSATHLDIWSDVDKETRFDSVHRNPEFPLQQSFSFHALQSFDLGQFMSENREKDWALVLGSRLFGVLENSPKLQNLKVYFRYFGGQSPSHFKNLFFDSMEKKINANLNHLHLDIPGLTDTDFSRLIPFGLRLKSLFLDVKSAFVHGVGFGLKKQCSFIDFLRSQSETLVDLEMRGSTSDVFERFEFPLLKKLKTLMITDWSAFGNDSRPSINYNERLPSLKKLEIEYCNDAWVQFLPDSSYPPVHALEHLKFCLYLQHGIGMDTEMYVVHAAQCFPNLRVLGEIPVNLRIANAIYKWLPQLEELTFRVGFTPTIDDIITGLSLEKCAELRRLPISEIMKLSVDNNEQDLDEDFLRPLSSLKNLKILRLIEKGSEQNHQPVEFSRVSTLLVLTKMSSLKTIDFGLRSRAYIEEIDDDIQNLNDSGKSVLYVEDHW